MSSGCGGAREETEPPRAARASRRDEADDGRSQSTSSDCNPEQIKTKVARIDVVKATDYW